MAMIMVLFAPNSWSGIICSGLRHRDLVFTTVSGGDPVSEVVILLLVGSGLIGLGWFVRRKLGKKA